MRTIHLQFKFADFSNDIGNYNVSQFLYTKILYNGKRTLTLCHKLSIA